MRTPGIRLHKLALFGWAVVITAVLLLLSLPVLAGKILPDLKMANCWEPLFYIIAQSAGNSEGLNLLKIFRDYTPEYFCWGLIFNTYWIRKISTKSQPLRWTKQTVSDDLFEKYKNYNHLPFSYYLTGLIEGDGSIIVPKTEDPLKEY